MPYRAAKGMNDILPDDIGRWHVLERAFVRSAELHGYREVRTPLLEPTELFVRSVGETTDIVQKEMFTLQHHGDSLTLRPEGTASAARAYVQHTVHAREPVSRWYYLGPMFRAERPQRGRYRQFFQAGLEIFGDPGPACDAELIDMLYRLFTELEIPDLQIAVSSIGGPATRARYRDTVREHLAPHAAELSEDSQRRLNDNPLRILDSKSEKDQKLVGSVPSILEALDDDDRRHWDELKAQLAALGVPFQVEPGLVRGLDYYTRTLFEFRSTAERVGAQNAIAGGGRYDAMIRDLGGPDVPAIGVAMGLDRILLAMGASMPPPRPLCFFAPIGEKATREALVLARALRTAGHCAEVDGRGRSVKSMLRRANAMGARLCLVLGEAELERGVVQLKDLERHTQRDVSRDAIVAAVEEAFGVASGGGSP